MVDHRTAVLFLGALAVTGAITATGGFSEVSAERGVDVRVVDDERAMLGITIQSTTGTVGQGAFTLLELADNFPQDVRVDSVSPDGGAPVDVVSAEMNGPVEVECTEATDGEKITLLIEVSGRDVQVQKYKRVMVTCYEPTPTPTPTPTPVPSQNDTGN